MVLGKEFDQLFNLIDIFLQLHQASFGNVVHRAHPAYKTNEVPSSAVLRKDRDDLAQSRGPDRGFEVCETRIKVYFARCLPLRAVALDGVDYQASISLLI